MADVNENASGRASIPIAHEVVWGPVRLEEARRCGAFVPCSSLLLAPVRNASMESLMHLALAAIPPEILPRENDTTYTLIPRLDQSSFLDDCLVRKGGFVGRSLQRLNATTYPQARTVSWAEPCEHSVGDEGRADAGVLLPFYLNPNRVSAEHVKCRAWPLVIKNLRDFCHALALPYFGEFSRNNKHNHVELKIYYTLLKSHIGRHRDNFDSRQLFKYLDTGTSPFMASPASRRLGQAMGSDVMIWTMGNAPMSLKLSFPAGKTKYAVQKTSEYILEPSFECECVDGTLFVFHCLDDLFFAHEAEFTPVALAEHPEDGYRLAFVFRNVSSLAEFHPESFAFMHMWQGI